MPCKAPKLHGGASLSRARRSLLFLVVVVYSRRLFHHSLLSIPSPYFDSDLGLQEACLDPNGPRPVVLMSLGRSGSSSIWGVLGNLTGRQTPCNEFTGSNTKKSIKFFENKTGSKWLLERLCGDQQRHPNATIVGFKWKPNEVIYSKPAQAGLAKMAELRIPIVRNRRNELDVVISREKHTIMRNNLGRKRPHCKQNDARCLAVHQKSGTGIALNKTALLDTLSAIRERENKVDKLLQQMGVPVVHVSYDKLYYDTTADEWMKIFRFLQVGPMEGLTMDVVRGGMTFVATSNRDHRAILAEYDAIAELLRGTEFENLLRS